MRTPAFDNRVYASYRLTKALLSRFATEADHQTQTRSSGPYDERRIDSSARMVPLPG